MRPRARGSSELMMVPRRASTWCSRRSSARMYPFGGPRLWLGPAGDRQYDDHLVPWARAYSPTYVHAAKHEGQSGRRCTMFTSALTDSHCRTGAADIFHLGSFTFALRATALIAGCRKTRQSIIHQDPGPERTSCAPAAGGRAAGAARGGRTAVLVGYVWREVSWLHRGLEEGVVGRGRVSNGGDETLRGQSYILSGKRAGGRVEGWNLGPEVGVAPSAPRSFIHRSR